MRWHILPVLGLSAMLISCSEDVAGPDRDLGAHVTYRMASGLVPREAIMQIDPAGRVDDRLVDVTSGADIWHESGALTSAEFDELVRLLTSFSEFESCYCSDKGPLDGPSESIRVAAESTVDVHIYGVPREALPAELRELVSLLSEVQARIRD